MTLFWRIVSLAAYFLLLMGAETLKEVLLYFLVFLTYNEALTASDIGRTQIKFFKDLLSEAKDQCEY